MRKLTVVEDLKIKTGGIYCFLPFERLDEHNCAVFKIGLSVDFRNRIEQYHTYFGLGVYMVAFLEYKGDEKKTRSQLQTIERYVFNHIKEAGGVPIKSTTRVKNSGSTEWIYTNEKDIHDAFQSAWKHFQGYKKHLFTLKGINSEANKREKKQPNYVAEIVYPIEN